MARKVLIGAHGAVSLAVGAARHLAWYFSYQVDGKAKDSPSSERE